MFLNKVSILPINRKAFRFEGYVVCFVPVYTIFPVVLHVALVYEIIFIFDLFTTFLLPRHDKG